MPHFYHIRIEPVYMCQCLCFQSDTFTMDNNNTQANTSISDLEVCQESILTELLLDSSRTPGSKFVQIINSVLI